MVVIDENCFSLGTMLLCLAVFFCFDCYHRLPAVGQESLTRYPVHLLS